MDARWTPARIFLDHMEGRRTTATKILDHMDARRCPTRNEIDREWFRGPARGLLCLEVG